MDTESKIIKWGVEIIDDCPGIGINTRLTKLRITERVCLALLNRLMDRHGYAYISNEQLAHWLGLQPTTVARMLGRFCSNGVIVRRNRKLFSVCAPWKNTPEERAEFKAMEEADEEPQV